MGSSQPGSEYAPNDHVPLREWEEDFKNNGRVYGTGPVQHRSCTDVCCLVTFFVVLLLFLGLGGYFIHQFQQLGGIVISGHPLPAIPSRVKVAFAFTCTGMIIGSLLLSIGLVALAKHYPKCLVWTLIVVNITMFLAISIAGFVLGLIALGISFLVATLIYCLVLFCCFRHHIKTAIVLMKCTGQFLSERPQVYLIGLIVSITSVLFLMYWIFSYGGLIALTQHHISPFINDIPTVFQIILWVLYTFFSLFFYYCTVFLVAACVAIWYYNQQQSMIGSAFNWLLGSHIGSITFSAMVVTVVRSLRMAAGNPNTQNVCLKVCLCLVQCLLASLECFLRLLNHYATISMAFTGQHYFGSAKTAGLLIFSNGGLFSVVDIIQNFFFCSSIVLCVVLPTIIATVIMVYSVEGGRDVVWYVVAFVILLSFLISTIFVTIFTEALSSIFVFYCMDKRLVESGFSDVNCPDSIRGLLEIVGTQYAPSPPPQLGAPDYYGHPPLSQDRVHL